MFACGIKIHRTRLLTQMAWRADVEQNLKQSLGYYSDILAFLRQHGALIANVKPEFLMLAEEYVSVSRKALEEKVSQCCFLKACW